MTGIGKPGNIVLSKHSAIRHIQEPSPAIRHMSNFKSDNEFVWGDVKQVLEKVAAQHVSVDLYIVENYSKS